MSKPANPMEPQPMPSDPVLPAWAQTLSEQLAKTYNGPVLSPLGPGGYAIQSLAEFVETVPPSILPTSATVAKVLNNPILSPFGPLTPGIEAATKLFRDESSGGGKQTDGPNIFQHVAKAIRKQQASSSGRVPSAQQTNGKMPGIAPTETGLTDQVGRPGRPSPATSVPTGSPGIDSGFSSNFGSEAWEDLNANPMELTRQWMLENGMDPGSNNPLIQARLRLGARSKGVYDLMNRTGEGAESNPSADKYLDFFSGFMENGMDAGAAPTLSVEQATQLLSEVMGLAAGGDTFWGTQLGADPEVNPETNAMYPAMPGEQAALISNLLASVFGGLLDPTALRGLTENVERQAGEYTSGAYRPGESLGGEPAVKDGEDFFDWLLRTGQAPMVADSL